MNSTLIRQAIHNYLKEELNESNPLEIIKVYLNRKVTSRETAKELIEEFNYIFGASLHMLDKDDIEVETTRLSLVANAIGCWVMMGILTQLVDN